MFAQREITDLLIHAAKGDRDSHEKLLERIYDELRALAGRHLRHERSGHTLQPTALVHEAYMRLVDQTRIEWENRKQFFALAARMMRRVLVDHARKDKAKKRGGGQAAKVPITQIVDFGIMNSSDLIDIDDALKEFAAFDAEKSALVELRFFAGMTMEKIAETLGVSIGKIERDWRLARAWIFKRLREIKGDGSSEMA